MEKYPSHRFCAGRSADDCVHCTLGHHCVSASVEPAACPAGTYFDGGADVAGDGNASTAAAFCRFKCRSADQAIDEALATGPSLLSRPLTDEQRLACELGCSHAAIAAEPTAYDSIAAATCVADCSGNAACEQGCSYYGVSTHHTLPGAPALQRSDCKACVAGAQCSLGTSTPLNCTIGSYSPPGAATCLPCKQGHVCNEPGLSQARMEASKQCPSGFACQSGLSDLAEVRRQFLVAVFPYDRCTLGHYLCPWELLRSRERCASPLPDWHFQF